MTDEEKMEVTNAFNGFDKGKTGLIMLSDASECLKLLGYNPTDKDMIDIIKESDSQRIGFNEFMAIVASLNVSSEERDLRNAFNVLDLNKTHKIEWKEFANLLKTVEATDREILAIRALCNISDQGDSFDYLDLINKIKSQI
jgi:Ca2+-binding EF-hand superfamily protein